MKKVNFKLILKKIIIYLIVLLSIYAIVSYKKFGLVAFDKNAETANVYGISFDEVLKLKKDSLINDIHFEVMKHGVILDSDVIENDYRYIYIYTNYLSNRITDVKIEYMYNSENKYQDIIELKEGTNVYKIPSQLKFNYIRLQSLKDVRFTAGISGLKLSSDFDFYKNVLWTSFLIFIVFLIIENRRKNILMVFRYFTDPMQEYINGLSNFIKENKKMIILISLLGLLSFGFMITNFTLSLDEELKMMDPHDIGWVGYGRFGIYFLDKLFLVGDKFTPYLTDLIAALFLTISTILFLFNFEQLSNKKNKNIWSMILFAGFFMSFPLVIGEYMSFAIYNMELGLGFSLVALGLYFSHQFYLKKTLCDLILSIIFVVIAISIYQSFVTVYLSGTIMYCILINFEEHMNHKSKMVLSKISTNAIILLICIIIYYVLNKYFQYTITPAYGYINQSFIGWNQDIGFLSIMNNVFEHIKFIVLGRYDSSGIILFVSVFAFVIHIIWKSVKLDGWVTKVVSVILPMLLIISPFSLMLVLGTLLPGRALQSLPLVLGCVWYLIIKYPVEKSWKKVVIIFSAFLLFYQIQYLNLMFYGDYVRYQQDIFIGRQVMLDVEKVELNYQDKPMVFIGSKKHDISDLISKVNTGGKSFFEDESQMYRMTYFLNTLGYNVITPTPDQIAEGNKYKNKLNSWPNENSIKVLDDLIIIKLSESK